MHESLPLHVMFEEAYIQANINSVSLSDVDTGIQKQRRSCKTNIGDSL